MADQLLNTIIALEKDLQEQIQREQSLASGWRDRQLAELAIDREQRQAELASNRNAKIEAARQTAVSDGERALAAARAWCARLESLPETLCIRHLKARLPQLLAEAGDDHPHGQD